MDVREQLLILRRSWRLITVLALLGTILAGVASLLTPTSYTASTSLFVSTQNSETSAELQQGSVFAWRASNRMWTSPQTDRAPTRHRQAQPRHDPGSLGRQDQDIHRAQYGDHRNRSQGRPPPSGAPTSPTPSLPASSRLSLTWSGPRTERRHRSGSARWTTPPRRPSRRVPTRSWTSAWAFCTGSQPESRRPYCAMSWTATSGRNRICER